MPPCWIMLLRGFTPYSPTTRTASWSCCWCLCDGWTIGGACGPRLERSDYYWFMFDCDMIPFICFCFSLSSVFLFKPSCLLLSTAKYICAMSHTRHYWSFVPFCYSGFDLVLVYLYMLHALPSCLTIACSFTSILPCVLDVCHAF